MTNNQLTDELRVLAYVERLKAAATVYLDVSAKDVPFYDKAVARRPFDLLLHPSDLLILIASYEAKEAELQELRKAAMDSGPVATLDVQSGRADGHKFALAYSSAAHKLPDGVYFLYCHEPTTSGRDSLPEKQASLEYTADIENQLEDALARVAELESELSEWTDCKHDGATYYDMSGRERCGRCGADI